ncbi:hypothetical protein ACH5RR_039220 [Cinchona calisaya]|uniref:RNase H type-1 domain-containing protein n=1 Tax=Cinchona calisaya TaxID=153742 RepID=A0ABD2XXL8_9GENT
MRYNEVKGLRNDLDRWCESAEKLEQIGIKHFSKIFELSQPSNGVLGEVITRVQIRVTSRMNDKLIRTFSAYEADTIHIFFECLIALQMWALSFLSGSVFEWRREDAILWLKGILFQCRKRQNYLPFFVGCSGGIGIGLFIKGSTQDPLSMVTFGRNMDGTDLGSWQEMEKRILLRPLLIVGLIIGMAIHAELLAAQLAIELAKILHINEVVLEEDALQVTNALRDGGKNLSCIGHIVNEVCRSMGKINVQEISWISRNGNLAAHYVAQLAKSLDVRMAWLHKPPSSLQSVIAVGDFLP